MNEVGEPRSDKGEAGNPIHRRQFLKMSAGAAAIAAPTRDFGALGSLRPQSAGSSVSTKVKAGGTLTAGLTGGTSADTLDAQNAITNVDFARIAQLYDTLFVWSPNVIPQPSLAEEITANKNATEWTIRLRKGVTFHNGKPFTAEDVIYSIRRIVNPKNPLAAAVVLAPIDASRLEAVDAHTVKVPCKTPFASFRSAAANQGIYMVPVGYNPKHPVGTGPFKFKSFTPGVQSTFVRNKNYWQHGLPYLDEVVMTNYADETSQVNALSSGAADIVNLLSADVISTVRSNGGQVVISDGGGATPFTLRVDKTPFKDVRVRQAMRLLVDRPQMRELVFGGYGTIGNDVFAIFDPEYNKQLPQRHQDLKQAKSLLKSAGHEGLQVELVTSNIAQGTVQMAQVFQQQAAGAGVKIQLRQVDVSDFFTGYLTFLFAQDFWFYSPYLIQVAETTVPGAFFNPCHWNNAKYNALYLESLRAVNHQRQTELVHEMMRIDYESGGYIIPVCPPVIDGYRNTVHGVVPSKTGVSFNNYDLRRWWLS